MFFFPPIPLIRKNIIINKLMKKNAVSIETAVTFKEAGIINPNGFPMITARLVQQGILHKDGEKYYLDATKI